MGWCMRGFGWGGMRGGGMILGGLLFVGVLVLLALAGVWLVRQLRHRPTAQQAMRDPLETARQRLAGGEITTAEFDEIRTRLQSGPS